MIIGAQKCGTTALAHYLGQHPEIQMSSKKEVHLFDSPNYSADWTPQQIDERYQRYFQSTGHPPEIPVTEGTPTGTPACTSLEGTPTTPQRGAPAIVQQEQPEARVAEGKPATRIRGEATPIYLFLAEIAQELKRYNPSLKLIVLMRDPVQRAISHYYMEKSRGYEQLPMWLALPCEPWRLRRCRDPRRHGSEWRRHSYRRRGLYSLQLRNLFRHFDARQVLLVRTEDLARNHDGVLQCVFEFLGVDPSCEIASGKVFEREPGGHDHAVTSWLLRVSFLPEFIRMRRFKAIGARD